MTREIKFRAWSSKNKEMIYFGSPEVLCDESEGLLFYRKNMALSVEMKRPKLMQFTGLHDKNGKEIYEGDVVRRKENDYVIEWGYGGYNERNNEVTRAISLTDTYSIIGNIYENPDLLSN